MDGFSSQRQSLPGWKNCSALVDLGSQLRQLNIKFIHPKNKQFSLESFPCTILSI